MDFDAVKKRFDDLKVKPSNVHPKIRGVLIGMIDKACGSKDNRYQFAISLGMKAHSKDWSDGEWWAVYQMIKPDKVGTHWAATEPKFQEIVDAVMRKVAENPAQIAMFE